MTKVVKEVIAEVRGKSDQFTAEMGKVEARAKAAKTGIEGVGVGSQLMGQRVADASRQIASATETIARSGKITGEAGKQIAAQASNIAFAFGPQGAAIGAVAIFGIAIATMFTGAKAAAREAREEFEKTLRVFDQNRDYRGAGNVVARVLGGDAAAEDPNDQIGLLRLRDRVAAERARRSSLPSTAGTTLQERVASGRQQDDAGFGELEAALTRLEARYAAAQRTFTQLASMETERLATLKKLADDEKASDEARAAAKRELAEAERDGLRAGAKEISDFEKAAVDAATRTDQLIRSTLETTTDAIARPFTELIAQLDQLVVDGVDVEVNLGRIAALEQLRDQAVEAAEAIGRAESLLSGLDTAAATGVDPTVDSFIALNAEIAALEAQLAGVGAGTKVFEQLSAKLFELQKRRQDLGKDVANANAPGGKSSGALDVRNAADYARELQQAVDGALQLAAALGRVNDGATTVLRSIAQIAGNLPALAEALKKGGGLGILSAALPIAGALASLVGPDPADAARRRALEDNTAAIRELTAKAGLLGIGVSGANAAGASSTLRGFLRGYAPGINTVVAGGEQYNASTQARSAARAAGIDLSELDRIAAEYGITLNGNIRSFEQLQQALQNTITKLGEFGTDLESQLNQASAAATIFGITDPLEKLGLTQGAYGGRSPVLDQALAGLDLSTAEGRAAAREALQAIFTTLQAGGGTLSAEEMGGLTGDELLQAILDLIMGLNDVDESLGLNTSTVAKGDRVIRASETQITADQASRLLGIETSSLAELRRIRALMESGRLAGLAEQPPDLPTIPNVPDLTPTAPTFDPPDLPTIPDATPGLPPFPDMTPLRAPALAAGFSSPTSAAAAGAITVYVSQEFHGAVSSREMAGAVADGLVEGIDRALGRRLLIQQRHVGKAVTS